MATRQDDIKAGTVTGAAERLSALREQEVTPEPSEAEPVTELNAEEPVAEPPIEEPPEPPEIIETPDEGADIFADDLDEAVETQNLEAPAAFTKEGKELFAKADPALQKEVAESLKAFQRGATQKVQQAVEKEKEVEQMAAQVLQMRDEWSRKLQSLDVALPEPPDEALADVNSESYDPDRFNVELARYERAKLNVEKNKAESQKLADETASQNAGKQQRTFEGNARRIVEYFPSWNTQEKFTDGVVRVQDWYAKEYGLTTEVSRGLTDSAVIKTGYKAMQYDLAKSKARAGKPRAPVSTAPSGQQRTSSTPDLEKARQSLKETGSLDDAVAVLSATRPKRK
jgi:hypothetical protein